MSRGLLIPLGLAAVLSVGATVVLAQVIQQSGHALDANLRLGSGGYNGAGGRGSRHANPYERRAYRAANAWPDYRNAFREEQRYNPALRSSSQNRSIGHGRTRPAREDAAVAREKYVSAYEMGYQAGLTDGQAAETTEGAAHEMELISYGVGFFLGEAVREALERDGFDADIEALIRGFRDGLMENAPQVNRERLEEILAAVHEEVEGRLVERLMTESSEFSRLAEENLARSRAFQDEYGKRQGVVTLTSGVQYRVLEPGTGRSPGPEDLVVVNYRVMLLDGTVVREATASVIELNDTTEGARQILTLMKEGGRWEVAIPPELAYGRAGLPPDIGPNESVFGVVELVEIKSP